MTAYTLAPPNSGNSCDSTMPTVLLLRGWTPGPINYLRTRLQNEFQCTIIEPQLLMPPFKGFWCFDLNFCLMCSICLALLLALYKVLFQFDFSQEQRERPKQFFYVVAWLSVLCVWIRFMVAVVARSAIADGVEKCLKEMRRRNVVLCVGFSWGAGVLSELLTRDAGLDTQPAFLLMAPVSSATATAAMRPDAAFRIVPLGNNNLVNVVHASDDPIFCPHPHRWDNVLGIKTYTLQDVHIFKKASSRRALAEIMTTLYRSKTQCEP